MNASVPASESHWRQYACMLALVACVFRAFIPAGFMLDSAHPGTMVVCSGAEIQKTITATPDTDPLHSSPKASHGDICGFSVNTGGVMAAAIPVPAPLTLAQDITSSPCVSLSGETLNPYSSRAPPLV
jgi:hypothetical protein